MTQTIVYQKIPPSSQERKCRRDSDRMRIRQSLAIQFLDEMFKQCVVMITKYEQFVLEVMLWSTVFDRISAQRAYFKFRVQGGRLIKEGRLFEERRLLTKLQGLKVCFYDEAFIINNNNNNNNNNKNDV